MTAPRASSRALPAVLGLVLLVSVGSACKGEQQLRDDCPTAGTACPACASDSDCIIASNACEESATCTHRDRNPPLGVIAIGCATEYNPPPAERCGCVARVCRTR